MHKIAKLSIDVVTKSQTLAGNRWSFLSLIVITPYKNVWLFY